MRPLARFILQRRCYFFVFMFSASLHNKRIKRNAQGMAVQGLKTVMRIPLMRRTLCASLA